uniref:Uncharacterized protein n=1 Tax=Eptatretus burgeri TaxID=7764 RepID=A0A8C4R332_EPTBU
MSECCLLYRGSKMPLIAFSFPLPETRLFRAGEEVYKMNLRPTGSARHCSTHLNNDSTCAEMEDAIRAVLATKDNLKPFTTNSFTIYPYKRVWEGVNEITLKHGNRVLKPWPYVFTLYIDKIHKHPQRVEATDDEPNSSSSSFETASQKQRR